MEQLALNAPLRSLARDLAEAGMARTLEAERESWVVDAIAAMRFFASGCSPFRMEEFRAWYAARGHRPHAHQVWGALANRAAREGAIRFTGRYAASTSPKTHGHPVRVWEAA